MNAPKSRLLVIALFGVAAADLQLLDALLDHRSEVQVARHLGIELGDLLIVLDDEHADWAV